MQKSTSPYVLFRVDQEGIEEPVGTFPSFERGWSAGQEAVHTDREGAFALYHRGRRVARFGFNRIAIKHASFDWSVLS